MAVLSGNLDRAVIAAPFGAVTLVADGGFLLDIALDATPAEPVAPASPLLCEAARQFNAYFKDPRQPFSLPLLPLGSAYQRRVWQALLAIPPGEAQSYGAIAAGLRSGPRAVAGACRANRYPIIVPCHRVVASNGLGGYCGAVGGAFLDIKRWLLRHEGHDTP